MKFNRTSLQEQTVFYYINKFFPDAKNRFIFSHDYSVSRGVEVDVYIPSIKVAIEYDGGYWHDNKIDKESLKNLYLNENGIYVFRIRDLSCPQLSEFYGKIIYHGKPPKGMHTNECIEVLLHEIAQFCTDESIIARLNNFSLSFEDYIKESPNIYSLLYPQKVRNNKSTFCGAEFWDKTLNGKLSLKNIPAEDERKLWVNFICKEGKHVHTYIYHLVDKKLCKKKCGSCFNSICHFYAYCGEKNCSVINNYLSKYFQGIENMKHEDAYLMWSDNELIDVFRFIRQRITSNEKPWIERFNSFFSFPLFRNGFKIEVDSLEDLKTILKYNETCGGLIVFDFMSIDNNIEKIDVFKQYLDSINLMLLNVIQLKDNKSISGYGVFCDRIHYFWLKNKLNISESLERIIVDFVHKFDENYCKTGRIFIKHKFD